MVYIVENNGVYGLTKGQFSATADRGSKSKRGFINTDNSDRSRGAGAAARRDVRRPLVLRRQAPAGADHQGGDRPQGRGLHRRDQPMRRLQQPRRLDQELRFRARAQRGGEPARLHVEPHADRGQIRARHGRGGGAARRLQAGAAQARRRLRAAPTAPPRSASCSTTPPRARSSPACSMSTPSRRTCTRICARSRRPLNALSEKELCPGKRRSTSSTPVCGRLPRALSSPRPWRGEAK